MACVFRLQTVLDYRWQVEEMAKAELGKATMRLTRHRMMLAELAEQRLAYSVELEARQRDGISAREHRLTVEYLSSVARRIEDGERFEEALEAEVGRCREVVVEAQRNRKVIERLRERHYDRWLLEERRAEQAGLDELAVLGHRRRNR